MCRDAAVYKSPAILKATQELQNIMYRMILFATVAKQGSKHNTNRHTEHKTKTLNPHMLLQEEWKLQAVAFARLVSKMSVELDSDLTC